LLVGTVQVAAAIAVGVALSHSDYGISQEDYRRSMAGAATVAGAIAAGAVRISGYERDQEREADFFGIAYMTKAGYDPRWAGDMLALWKAYKLGIGDPLTVPFLEAHPPTAERVVRARKWALLERGDARSSQAQVSESAVGSTEVDSAVEQPGQRDTGQASSEPDTQAVSNEGEFCWTGVGPAGESCESCCKDGVCSGRCTRGDEGDELRSVERPLQCWNTDGYEGDQALLCTTCCSVSVTCDTTCVEIEPGG
jgi:hypothetical protein